MKDTLANKLASFKGTLAVADKDEFNSIWLNKPPLAFGKGLTAARTAVQGLASTGAEQSVPTTGSTGALKGLRSQFEQDLHPLARATYRTLKALGREEDAAKADLTPSDLHNARAQALAGFGETVLDLAEPLSATDDKNTPGSGVDFGVTPNKVVDFDQLWERYSTAVGAPVGARARRKALTNALPGQFAAVEEKFALLDDLIVQFRGSELGDRFVDTWFNARHVVDLGRRANKHTPPAPTPTPANP